MPPPHEQHSCGRSMRRALCGIISVADAKLVLRCSSARSRPCVLRLVPQASVRVHSGHSAPRFACAQLGAGAKGNVQRAHAIEQPAPERLNIFSCCGQCLQLSVVLASAEWHLQLSECCSRDFRGTCFVPVILRQNGREQNIVLNFTPLRRMALAHRRKVHSAHVYLDHSCWLCVTGPPARPRSRPPQTSRPVK